LPLRSPGSLECVVDSACHGIDPRKKLALAWVVAGTYADDDRKRFRVPGTLWARRETDTYSMVHG
jgi:hypothetical protein